MKLTAIIIGSLLATLVVGITAGYFAPIYNYAWYWKVIGTVLTFGSVTFVLYKFIDATVSGMEGLVLVVMLFGVAISSGIGWLIGRLLR